MDLRHPKAANEQIPITNTLGRLPPRLRLAVIRETIEVCDETEIDRLALELITLASPAENTDHKQKIRFLDLLIDQI
ncbi:MAG: hypothetical protein K8E66_13800, partial [Phycisphaerales bacterium]|nr:hypothetical protein [Phycisphaerales bacterium]